MCYSLINGNIYSAKFKDRTQCKNNYLFGVIVRVKVVFRKKDSEDDSEDDYRSGSRNVSHQQQSF